jgi:hypothetical protein
MFTECFCAFFMLSLRFIFIIRFSVSLFDTDFNFAAVTNNNKIIK